MTVREFIETLEVSKNVEIFEEDGINIIFFEAFGYKHITDSVLNRIVREWNYDRDTISIIVRDENNIENDSEEENISDKGDKDIYYVD